MPIDQEQLERGFRMLARAAEEDRVPAAGAVVGGADWASEPKLFGRQRVAADSPVVRPDALFLIASPTKPIVALAVMQLVEEGLVKLNDPVVRYLPDFAANGKRSITLAHCLTHTSGLPDMPPG